MSTIAAFKAAKSIGIKPPRLGYMESISEWRLTDDTLTLRVERVKGRESGLGGRDFKITHRGVEIRSWRYNGISWVALEPFTMWSEVEEIATSTPARTRDPEWESMCYRPGTHTSPMDNAGRIAQGY
jgi:hypothetical protein